MFALPLASDQLTHSKDAPETGAGAWTSGPVYSRRMGLFMGRGIEREDEGGVDTEKEYEEEK